MRLTPHFTLAEFTISQTATRFEIDNTPSADETQNLIALAEQLERVRLILGNKPIVISSGYRSPKVNTMVGGAKTSQHTKGQAADFTCPAYGTPFDVCMAIISEQIPFDQLIHEYGEWVHMSVAKEPRGQILTKFHGTPYMPGLRRTATSMPLEFSSMSK